MSVDLQNTKDTIDSRLKSTKLLKEILEDGKQLSKEAGNSLQQSVSNSITQLDKIANQQKRFQRNVPTSMDSLVNLIFGTRGSGSDTVKYIRKKILEVMVNMEPQMTDIIQTSSFKALGCSQEQTYPGIDLNITPINSLNSYPLTQGLFIPIKSIDFLGNLTLPVDSIIGKFYYEKPKLPGGALVPYTQQTKSLFKPYGGFLNVPMNRLLKESINNGTTLYSQTYTDVYKGLSVQNLFDFNYVTSNGLGVSGNFYRMLLINRNDTTSQSVNDYKKNKVRQFLGDYYRTIKLIDPVNVIASLVNFLTHFIDIKVKVGYEKVKDDNQFNLLLQRILGLCFDSRKEIDVSGISKIAELDGVDDSFFEFSEIELRLIDETISNIQKGVVTFEDCGNVQLPVDADIIIEDFINFRDNTGNNTQEIVSNIENILDNIAKNPNWRLLIPTDVDLDFTLNKQILTELPKAVAYSVLNPKVLLPIFLLLQVVEQSAKNEANQLIQSGNTVIQSGNSFLQSGTTAGQNVNNLVESSVDFVKKFKSFVIEVVSKINSIFLEELYNILKKDIINLLYEIIKDINKSAAYKKYAIIFRLLQIAVTVSELLNDFRKCKSLFDSILKLLNLINEAGNPLKLEGRNIIPLPLLALTNLLPGTSPERMVLNVLDNLDKLGIPTGRGPGNKANLMNQFMHSMFKGLDKENAENGKVEIVLDASGILGYGKHI
jgi:hypothetical protein